MLAWHHISQAPRQTIWAHFVAARGTDAGHRVSAGMNYFRKLLIKLSNCPNFATFFTPSMQKRRPGLGFFFRFNASEVQTVPQSTLYGSARDDLDRVCSIPKAFCKCPGLWFLNRHLYVWQRAWPSALQSHLPDLAIVNLGRSSEWLHKNDECSRNAASTERSSSWTGTKTTVSKRVYVGGWKVTALDRVSTQTNVFMRRNALKCSNTV